MLGGSLLDAISHRGSAQLLGDQRHRPHGCAQKEPGPAPEVRGPAFSDPSESSRSGDWKACQRLCGRGCAKAAGPEASDQGGWAEASHACRGSHNPGGTGQQKASEGLDSRRTSGRRSRLELPSGHVRSLRLLPPAGRDRRSVPGRRSSKPAPNWNVAPTQSAAIRSGSQPQVALGNAGSSGWSAEQSLQALKDAQSW